MARKSSEKSKMVDKQNNKMVDKQSNKITNQSQNKDNINDEGNNCK